MDQLLRHNYTRFRYFGVSALGDVPLDRNRVGDIRPHRVQDPLLWLLGEFGTIPVTKA